MSVYVICPHCGHPSVVSRRRAGKERMCRQCRMIYFVEESASLSAEAIPVQSATGVAFPTLRQVRSPFVPALELV